MKKENFDIKFKDFILKGKAKVFFENDKIKEYVRIICWDRNGVKNGAGEDTPIIALLQVPGSGEVILELTIDGHLYSAYQGSVQALYVEYDAIGISKAARVCYSLLRHPYLERFMQKYGYEEDEEKGWHWNAVQFANIYAKSHTNELHADLKAEGKWDYDDDYDWK